MSAVDKSFAYFVLLRSNELESQRVGLAATFPLHITIKGRFAPVEGIGIDGLAAHGRQALAGLRCQTGELIGPVQVSGRLVWFEPAERKMRIVLEQCHQLLLSSLESTVDADFVPEEFQRGNFRPHVTINFGDVAVSKSPERRVAAALFGWGIYEYDGHLADAPARLVYTHPLQAP